jgi:hypothetical protein
LAAIFSRSIKTIGSFLGVFALLAAGPASATLTLIDDPVFGPMSLVLDTTTNLEWLRVDLTSNGPTGGGLAVLGQLGPGQKFAGFRFAGTNNWAGLMAEFGLPTMPGPPNCFGDVTCSIDPTIEANLTGLFGIPLGAGVNYNYTPPGPQIFFDSVFLFPGGVMEYSGFGEGCSVGIPTGCLASLVRDALIPEPPSIWTLIAGLLTFPVARRLFPNARRRRQAPGPCRHGKCEPRHNQRISIA